jgi:peptidyl-prolyl cis-trans isomerase SurA
MIVFHRLTTHRHTTSARRARVVASILAVGLIPFSAVVDSSTSTSAMAQSEYVIDKIVAVVDGEIILKSEVDALVLGVAQQQRIAPNDQLWRDALSELVDQKVLLAHAKKDTTLIIAEEQIQGEIDQRIQRLAQQSGSESKLEELYGKTIAEIKAELTPLVREQITASEYQRRYLQTVKVTPSEVRAWFDRIPQDSLPTLPEIVRVAHVVRLPEVDPRARDEAMQVITALRDSVAKGKATIEELSTFSDDPSAVDNRGRYRDIPIRDLVSEFGAVAGQLEPNELSQVFETQFGLHFMRLHRRTGDVVDFSHILTKIDNSRVDPSQSIDLLALIRDSVSTMGLPFELAAKRHSEEPRSAVRGGYVADPATDERDLVLEALGPAWTRTVNALEVGDLSEPDEFQLLDGRRAWHIVLLQSRVPAHTVNLEDDYARVEQIVLQEKRQLERDAWVRRLRNDVHIEMRVSEETGLAVQ